tara:strand:- start:761 stop:877 length:117 start_codon:yes stop_codon:yes gene_type:complete
MGDDGTRQVIGFYETITHDIMKFYAGFVDFPHGIDQED